MSKRNLIARFSILKQTWSLILPTLPLPSQATMIQWLALVDDDAVIERAILKSEYLMRLEIQRAKTAKDATTNSRIARATSTTRISSEISATCEVTTTTNEDSGRGRTALV